jgi:hypothetical protein
MSLNLTGPGYLHIPIVNHHILGYTAPEELPWSDAFNTSQYTTVRVEANTPTATLRFYREEDSELLGELTEHEWVDMDHSNRLGAIRDMLTWAQPLAGKNDRAAVQHLVRLAQAVAS